MKKKTPLSASRIKTLESCSWYYYCNYILKLPDSSNAGSIMGSVCHNVYEFLGQERRRKYFDTLIYYQNIASCKLIERYIISFLKKEGLDPNGMTVSGHGEQVSHIDLVERMLFEGLNYDFFGNTDRIPTESHSEIDFDFDVEEGPISYRFRGFIDKLFLFEEDLRALIRDFKSSKKTYKGKELVDNIQHQLYELALKKLFPEYSNRQMEFVFLQHLSEGKEQGLLNPEKLSDAELDGLEHYLSDIQKIVDNFDEKLAVTNFAADKGYVSDYEGFDGLVKCGRAESPKDKKVDGSKKWHCPMKFSYFYYELKEDDKIIKTAKLKKDLKKKKGQVIEKKFYGGCPKFGHLKYNKDLAKKAGEEGHEIQIVEKSNKSVDSCNELW